MRLVVVMQKAKASGKGAEAAGQLGFGFSPVKAHARTTPSGKRVVVKAHQRRRQQPREAEAEVPDQTKTRKQIATGIRQALERDDQGFAARVWTGGDHVRVYVDRVKRTRTYECGYVDLTREGVDVSNLYKHAMMIEDVISEAGLMDLEVAPEAEADWLTKHEAELVRRARDGTLRARFSEDQIAQAVQQHVITESEAMNQDL